MSDSRTSATSPPELTAANLSISAPHRISMPLVGRDGELKQLDAILARAVEYQAPQLITVVGTQGTGKTRLIAEWLSRTASRQPAGTAGRPRLYRGRAIAGSGSYALISRILRDRFGIQEHDDEPRRHEKVRTQLASVFADRRMAEVIHFLGRYLDLRIAGNAFIRAISLSEDPSQEDRIARTVLRRFLELDAERSPLVLAFDDLHLADDDSLTLLGELAHGLSGSPVLIVAAARPELFVRRPTWGSGTADHTRVDVPPLSRVESERMLRQLLARAEPLPAELIEDACELVRGNPFFIEELVRVFFANGTVSVHGDKWRVDGARAASASLPMSIEEAIEARIASLSPGERELLEKAATLGSVFWLGAMVVLSRLERDGDERSFSVEERARIEATLEELVERDYLLKMPDSSVPGESEYIFKHNLEHDLVLKLVPAERSRRYYRAAAEWLETRLPSDERDQTGEQLEHQAALYGKGGNRARAADRFIAAAQKARARYANDTAAELYGRGLELLDAEDLLARIDPLHDYGDVLMRAGRNHDALAAFKKMLDAAWQLDDAPKAGAAHGRIARAYRGLGDYDAAENHLNQALQLFRTSGDTRGVAAVEDDLGRVAFLRGAYTQALERHGRALDLRRALADAAPAAAPAQAFADRRNLALSLHNLAMVHQASGAHAEAMMRFSEALALRREIGDRPGVVQSLQAVALAWRDRSDTKRCIEVLHEALELAQEIGDRVEQASILLLMGDALLRLGREPEATEHLEQATELAQSFGDRALESEAARLSAEVHLGVGDFRAARKAAERALELADKVGSRPLSGVAHRVLGAVLAKGGITDDDKALADEHLQKSIAILGEVGYELELGRSYQSYANVLAERGDTDGAVTLNERATEISSKLTVPKATDPNAAPSSD